MAELLACTSKSLSMVRDELLKGGLVALPTETVYGLAARADDPMAVDAIYQLKGRPSYNPLIIHCADAQMAWRYVEKTSLAEELGQSFWPGPLTLVLKKRKDCYIAPEVHAGLSTLAVRIPASSMTQAIIKAVGCPLAMPSANPSGRLSPTMPSHVLKDFPHHPLWVLDGGACPFGIESTIVAVESHSLTLLRSGSITKETLANWSEIRLPSENPDPNHPTAPGMLASHYAPQRPLKKNVTRHQHNQAFLGFGDHQQATDLNLSPRGCLEEAARHLYQYLHLLDRSPFQSIAVAPIPEEGIGIAINDRLTRASNTSLQHKNGA